MPERLVIVSWPDFQSDEAGPAASAPLLAQALWRRFLAPHSTTGAWAFAGADRSAAAAFQRWQFSLLATPPAVAVREGLLAVAEADGENEGETPPPLLVMSARNAAETAEALGLSSGDYELLTPSFEEPAHADTSASRVLRLETAAPVGLFAEWSIVARTLRGGHPATTPREILVRMVQRAELAGTVVTARVYSDWASGASVELAGAATVSFPATGSLPTELAAETIDDAICEDLRQALGDPYGPRTWILVSEAPWLEDMVRQAHEAGIRVVLWQPRGERCPQELRAQLDAVHSLENVLDLASHSAPAERPFQMLRADVHAERIPARVVDPVPAAPIPVGAQLSSWVRLIYRVECVLRGNRWQKIPYRKLAVLVAEDEEFGPTAAQSQLWLNRAQSESMLTVVQETHRSDPNLRVAMCRLNPTHPITSAALDVPESCIRLLRQMLQKMPWVSFKLLRGVLLREQWLGGPPFSLDEAAVDEWLNFLVRDGALRMTKEPNLENPEYPVTALRLNQEHPLCRNVLTQAQEGRRLAAERAILAIDHFTRRNRKPWMAMSALRRALTGMGRDELQEVLQGLQNLGAVVTESYPNPRKEHFTTGCRLQVQEPFVQQTLQARDQIIRVTQYHQRSRTWVPVETVEQELRTLGREQGGEPLQSSWLMLLRDEGILELDQDSQNAESWSGVQCRLNVSDAVVRSVLSEVVESGYTELGPAA